MPKIFPEDPFGGQKDPIKEQSPSPELVNKFHARSDKDTSAVSQHHTLGIGENQAASGAHTHDGRNSKQLLEGFDPTFLPVASGTYSQSQMQDVIDALVALGLGS